MSKYEREWVPVSSLEVGNTFEHPCREDTLCRCEHHSLEDTPIGEYHLIGYSIIEGNLHWPVIRLPMDYQVCLLIPMTTFVQLSGKDFIDSLVDQHGVTHET